MLTDFEKPGVINCRIVHLRGAYYSAEIANGPATIWAHGKPIRGFRAAWDVGVKKLEEISLARNV